jgi:hypothetical protein
MSDQIYENSVVVVLSITTWSASKKLQPDDFLGADLPPEDVVSLGSKFVHNKETMRDLLAVRTKAISYMESVGVSLYGSKLWIVPQSRISDVQESLEGLAREYETERHLFLQRFHDDQQDWLDRNSRWANILQSNLETRDSIGKKFTFQWRVFRISALDDADASEISDDLTSTMFKEISVLSQEVYESLRDREKASNKHLNRVDRLLEKLRGLSFVNPAVSIIETELGNALNERDSAGVLTGQGLFNLVRLLLQLKSPQVLQDVLLAASHNQSYNFSIQHQTDTVAIQPQPQPPNTPAFGPPSVVPASPSTRLPASWF